MNASPKVITRQADDETLASVSNLPIHPMAKQVLANRASKYHVLAPSLLDCSLRDLDSPMSLPDIKGAAERIASAIVNGEVIGLETDHDVDGVTSHAVLYSALHNYFGHPKEKIRSFIGHRMKEGYGLSDALCNRILADEVRPSLIITADNGSSDALRITRLLQNGIQTIVTDHHGMPEEGPPADAIACVSPARPDSHFPDPLIAGVMVSFLLSCVVRQELINIGHLDASAPRLSGLLDYVAVGTVADCVSLARSRNNRAVIRAGLIPINQGVRPCWRAIKPYLGDADKTITSSDLGFGIGPRINAVGRLDDAMVGVKFLLAEDDAEAHHWVKELNEGNLLRREIENELKEEAVEVAQLQVESGRTVTQVCLTEGHAGVHGIVASRLVERFGRPAVCFSQKLGEPGILTGSARAIEGVHIRDAMQAVEDQAPGLLMKFGGHEGAGGLTLKEEDFPQFEKLFESIISQQAKGLDLAPAIFSDGPIKSGAINIELVEGMKVLEPFGREFESPLFTANFRLLSADPMGESKQHWRFDLVGVEGGTFKGVWFNAGDASPLNFMDSDGFYRLTFSPELNYWKGRTSLQLMIRGANPAPDLAGPKI